MRDFTFKKKYQANHHLVFAEYTWINAWGIGVAIYPRGESSFLRSTFTCKILQHDQVPWLCKDPVFRQKFLSKQAFLTIFLKRQKLSSEFLVC